MQATVHYAQFNEYGNDLGGDRLALCGSAEEAVAAGATMVPDAGPYEDEMPSAEQVADDLRRHGYHSPGHCGWQITVGAQTLEVQPTVVPAGATPRP